MREIKIKISIQDDDVQASEASLRRLGKAANDVGNAGKRINYDSPEFKAKTAAFKKDIEDFKKKSVEVKEVSNSAAQDTSSWLSIAEVGIGTFLGNLAGTILNVYSQIASKTIELTNVSIKMAGDFEQIEKRFISFAGSGRLAATELANIDNAARQTDNLRIEAAEVGYEKLRRLGLQAAQTTDLIVALGASPDTLDKLSEVFVEIKNGSEDTAKTISELLKKTPELQRDFYDAFGTINSKEIEKFFSSNPDATFKKLTDAIAKNRTEIGGFNSSIGELKDEFLVAGREFGKPIIQPLTRDIKELTEYLRNNQSEWKKLGTSVADFYNGLSLLSKNVSGGGVGSFLVGAFEKQLDQATNGIYSQLKRAGQAIEEFGKIEREFQEKKDRKKFFSDFGKDNPNLVNDFAANNFTFDLSKPILTDKETSVNAISEQQKVYQKLNADMEKLRQDEIGLLRSYYDERVNIIDSAQKREIAVVESRLTYSIQDEIEVVKQRSAIQNKYLTEQFQEAQVYYNLQLAQENLSAADITKIKLEAAQKLRSINNEMFTNELRTQREIAEKERQILEQRRQTQIEFFNLSSRQVSQNFDKQIFDTTRAIERGNVDVAQGYDALLKLTQDKYQAISQFTKNQFAIRLQDERLSIEQRKNLQTEMYLAEQDLAEQNRRTLLDIEDKQHQERIRKIEQNLQRQNQLLQDSITSYRELFSADFNLFRFPNVSESLERSIGNNRTYKEELLYIENKLKGQIQDTEILIKGREELLKKKESETSDSEYGREGIKNEINQIKTDIEGFNKTLVENQDELKNWRNNLNEYISKDFQQIGTLLEKVRTATTDKNTFDEIRMISLKNAHLLEMKQIENEIKAKQELAGVAKTIGEANAINFEIQSLQNRKLLLTYQQVKEVAEAYSKTLEGLNEEIKKLRSGDKGTSDALNDIFNHEQKEQEKSDLIEIARLKYDIANSPYIDSLAIEKAGLQDIINLRNQETDAIIRGNRAKLELSQKGAFSQLQSDAKVLEHINSNTKSLTDSLADFKIGLYDNFSNNITSPFDALEKKLESLPPLVQGLAKSFLDLARDIIKAFSQKLILKLLGLDGGSSSSSGGGFSLSNIFGGGNSTSSNGGGGFSLGNIFGGGNGASGGGNGFNLGSIFGGGNSGSGGNSPISFLPGGNTRNFSTLNIPSGNVLREGAGGGGRFNLSSGIGLASMAATLIGGAVGGRFGNVLSMAGTGAGIGLQFGGPIGAAIGAAAGGLFGLFMGDPKRKQDKKENMPKLQQGFTDAFKEMRQLLEDVQFLRVDPDGALSKARELREQIASGFGVQFLSKKYKKESQNQIKMKLAEIDREPDGLMTQIKKAVEIAKGAADRNKRILPEFAAGVFMSSSFASQFADFKRQNGMMHGTFTGNDSIRAMIAPGEMVLNPNQINNVRANAGFDAFAGAGIPNYASGIFIPPSPSSPKPVSLASPNITVSPNFSLELYGVAIDNQVEAYLTSDAGKRVQIKINKTLKKSGDNT